MASTVDHKPVQSSVVAARRSNKKASDQSGRLNIRDVARHAGVSIGTVSLAINNRPGVNEKTRDQVLRVVEELGYVPSMIGRAINRCRSGVLGVLVPIAHSPLFSQVVAGINDEAEDDRGMPIFVSFSQDKATIESRMLRMFSQLKIDGLLLAATPDGVNGPLVADLFAREVPVVQVERQAPGLRSDFVGSENREAAREQTLRLLSQGAASVGLVTTRHHVTAAEERQAGWRSALLAAGIEPQASWVCMIDEQGAGPIDQAFAKLLDDPAFPRQMLWSAGATSYVSRVLNDRGLNNGQDVEVVLFDADPKTDFHGQSFVHVEQDGYQLGRAAARLLLQRCDALASDPDDQPLEQGRTERRFPCVVEDRASEAGRS